MDPESKTTLLAVLVQAAIQDIAFFKRQQVITTTYVVAVQFGVIALVTGDYASDYPVLVLWTLSLLALSLLAVVVGWVILFQLEKSIGIPRRRLEEYDDEHFPTDCFVLSFRAIARASKLLWNSLSCEVEGTLDRVGRTTSFTEFKLASSVASNSAHTNDARAQRILEKAEESCLITNSLFGSTHLDAKIEVSA